MDEGIVKHFNNSLERCFGQKVFMDDFYQAFIASSEEISEKFKNTDLAKQKKMVKASLYILMTTCIRENYYDFSPLAEVAELHSRRGRNISPHLYDNWLECLMLTVKKHDPAFTEEVERSWLCLLLPAIGYMKSRY